MGVCDFVSCIFIPHAIVITVILSHSGGRHLTSQHTQNFRTLVTRNKPNGSIFMVSEDVSAFGSACFCFFRRRLIWQNAKALMMMPMMPSCQKGRVVSHNGAKQVYFGSFVLKQMDPVWMRKNVVRKWHCKISKTLTPEFLDINTLSNVYVKKKERR